MNTHRLLALTICIAALNASQTVLSQSTVKSSLCTSANSVETIREQIDATRTFDDNRQRLRVLLRSADLLWPIGDRQPALLLWKPSNWPIAISKTKIRKRKNQLPRQISVTSSSALSPNVISTGRQN
jgi:hypothetical protein